MDDRRRTTSEMPRGSGNDAPERPPVPSWLPSRRAQRDRPLTRSDCFLAFGLIAVGSTAVATSFVVPLESTVVLLGSALVVLGCRALIRRGPPETED
jgi:hypothetical protein